jgi:hypothetical protein
MRRGSSSGNGFGFIAVVGGLIGMNYTYFHDIIWNRFEGWIDLGWWSQVVIGGCTILVLIGAILIGRSRRRGVFG